MAKPIELRESHGGAVVEIAVHVVFDDCEAVRFSDRKDAMAVGRVSVRARRVLQQRLHEKRARTVHPARGFESLEIRSI